MTASLIEYLESEWRLKRTSSRCPHDVFICECLEDCPDCFEAALKKWLEWREVPWA